MQIFDGSTNVSFQRCVLPEERLEIATPPEVRRAATATGWLFRILNIPLKRFVSSLPLGFRELSCSPFGLWVDRRQEALIEVAEKLLGNQGLGESKNDVASLLPRRRGDKV